MNPKPFSQACENNYRFILPHLVRIFAECDTVVEVGSGTGQHAYYFAQALPHLIWQTSDLAVNHEGIMQWVAGIDTIKPPLVLDANELQWPALEYDGVYTANTLHIMSWLEVEKLFQHVGVVLKRGGKLVIYGPFKVDGHHTSESNAAFDAHLKQAASHRGIRDLGAVKNLAQACGIAMAEPTSLPANNMLLTFTRQ